MATRPCVYIVGAGPGDPGLMTVRGLRHLQAVDGGGKEVLFLHEQQIPFEVVPGVPATVAVPAYAGIPVTYPGAGDTVIFVRGHEAETDDAPSVDWQRLAGIDGTLVCYAASRRIEAVTSSLLAHGRSPEETAALIYAGTTPAQET